MRATQIAQAEANAAALRIDAEAQARAEAIRITTVAEATAESIRRVNEAVAAGGESYFRFRQIEMLPQLAPAIAEALARARMVTINSGSEGTEGGAPGAATDQIASVIRTVLAAQLVGKQDLLGGEAAGGSNSRAGGRRVVGRRFACRHLESTARSRQAERPPYNLPVTTLPAEPE